MQIYIPLSHGDSISFLLVPAKIRRALFRLTKTMWLTNLIMTGTMTSLRSVSLIYVAPNCLFYDRDR